MTSTATTVAARDHARAQAGARAEAMPTVPPWSTTDPPPGVDAATIVWEETIPPGGYAAKAMARGTRVRLLDVSGDACANVIVHNLRSPVERLNVADTVKVQWQAYLGAGAVLLSDQGRALMTIAVDGSGVHDCFSGASNLAANTARYGDGTVYGAQPNARDRFAVAIGKFGLDRRDIPPSISLFKGIEVEADGAMRWRGAPGPTGAAVELIAEMDVLFTVANTAHVLDPRPTYTCGPLRITAWTAQPTADGSAQWCSSPERERAYRNTQAWLAGLPA